MVYRIELVGEAGGVSWYDDSKATTPHAASVAIRAFDHVVLIAGGRNKGLDLTPMTATPERIRAVVAIGEAADDVAAAFAPALAASGAPIERAGVDGRGRRRRRDSCPSRRRRRAVTRLCQLRLVRRLRSARRRLPPARRTELRSPATQAAAGRSSAAPRRTGGSTRSRRGEATMTATQADPTGGVAAPSSSADRRRAVLARLQGEDRARGTGNGGRIRPRPTRTHLRLPSVRNQPGLWDTPATPAPIGYYVIAVVVAMFVMLGLVMVLSASAQVEGSQLQPLRDLQPSGAVGCARCGRPRHGAAHQPRVDPAPRRSGARAHRPRHARCRSSPASATLNDARAWITFGNFTVQPSEFLKLAVVLFAADLLVRRQDELSDVRRSLKPLLLLAGFAAGACLVQGDLGSAIVMTAIVLGVAFIGGVPLLPMIATTILSAVTAVAFVFSSALPLRALHRVPRTWRSCAPTVLPVLPGPPGDRRRRPDRVGRRRRERQARVPAARPQRLHLRRRRRRARLRRQHRRRRRLRPARVVRHPGGAGRPPTASGCSSPVASSAWFGVQAIVNIGGVTGLMPVTGLTLPFFSAGGSSLFVSMVAAGLLLNVARRGGRPTE